MLTKKQKGWVRKEHISERLVERHLCCIEDPFDLSHDLGRTIDPDSLRGLRAEFERAAAILARGPGGGAPATEALFEPVEPREAPRKGRRGPPPPRAD